MARLKPGMFIAIPRSLDYNPVFDGIRGVAILLVVIFHYFPNVFPFGYVGVDLFFALSGYLITLVILNKMKAGRFTFAEFYRNRARRLFPALSLILFAALVLGYLFLFPQEYAQLGLHVNSSAWYYQNFRLIHEIGYWDAAAISKPLLHIWSLSVEEQFYLIWPSLLVILMYFEHRYKIKASIGTFILLVFFFVVSIVFVRHNAQAAFYHTLARVWEPLFGATLALFNDAQFVRLPRVISWLGLFSLLIYTPKSLSISHYDPLRIGIFLILSFLWVLPILQNRKSYLTNPVLVWFGLVSYSLYLWHYMFLSFLFILGYESYLHYGLLASVLFASLTFVFVEVPARRQQSYIFAITLTGLLGFIGLTGYFIYKESGLPARTVAKTYKVQSEQFVRAERTNKLCKQLVKAILNKSPYFDYCKSTSASPNSIRYAVVGDSHAEVLYNGISERMKLRGINGALFANSGNPPYLGGYRGHTLDDIKVSKEKIDQIYQIIDKLPELKVVVFATRMAIYASEQGYGRTERRFTKNPSHYRIYFENPAEYDPEQLFYAYLKHTLAYFSQRNLNVLLVLENPELGFLPNSCIQRGFLPPSKHCLVPRAKVDARLGELKSKVREYAKQFPNVSVIDLEDFFCDQKWCYVVRNGTMLYADDDHLSLAASREIAEWIEPILLRSLFSSSSE